MDSPPMYGYYDYLEAYYESYYERRHNRLLNESCHDRSLASAYYNSSVFFNPICAQIRNMTAYDYVHSFPAEFVVPPLASLSIIGCFVSIMIAISFFYQLSKIMKKKKAPDKITIFITSFCIISHIIYNLIDPILFYLFLIDYEPNSYRTMTTLYESFWGLAKVSLYSVFAYRYFILSKASIFENSSRCKTFLSFGSVICIIFIQLSLQIAYIFVLHKYYTVGWESLEMELYYMRWYLNIGWCIAAVDFVVIGVLGFLIIRTILRLVIMIDFRSDHSELSMSPSSIQSVQSNSASSVSSEKNKKQKDLIEVSTRIAVTCLFSMLSSLSVYVTLLIIEETENWHLTYISYFWCVDNVVNMSCVYFSMAFSKHHYKILCQQYCFCHQCFYCCVDRIVTRKINKKHQREMEEGQNSRNKANKVISSSSQPASSQHSW